jgi:hypothetical protein
VIYHLQVTLRRTRLVNRHTSIVCLISRLLRALHLDIFEQPVQNRVFQQAAGQVHHAFTSQINRASATLQSGGTNKIEDCWL